MKKIIALQDLDCANCAAKMENEIKKIDGIKFVSVNFVLQKMTLDITDGNAEKIIREVKAVCKRVEPSCKLKI